MKKKNDKQAAAPPYEEFAGEVRVENGKPPRWLRKVPYVGIVLALGYYVLVGVTDPVNLGFAALFVFWAIYTPIAQKKGWFSLPM